MPAINTQIVADPASCRAGADYLMKLADANEQAATAAYRSRSMAESWHGQASQAFQDVVNRNARDIDELVRVIRKGQRGLTEFAENIEVCNSRMQNARETAKAAGLTVTGWWIHQPPGVDQPFPDDGKGDPDLPGLNPKGAEQQRKKNAWDEAESLVKWARALEGTAHEELNSALNDANNAIAPLKKPMFWIGSAAAYAGGMQGAAVKLRGMADEQLGFIKEFKRLASDSALPAETRQASVTKLMENYGLARYQAESNAGALGNLGNTKIGNYVFNPLTKTFGGSKPGILRTAGRQGSLAGFALTAANTAWQIAVDGKPVGKTISTNLASWGVGTATGAGVALVLGAAGVASAPVTLTAIGVGTAASMVYGYFQDNTWQDFKHDAGETGKEILDEHSKGTEADRELKRRYPGASGPKI